MKQLKITFWISTVFITLMMLNSAYMCFYSPYLKASIAHLGFPSYFRVELGIAKLLGAIALILPMIPKRIKEFAYHGFLITFVCGVAAHMITGDPATVWGAGLVALTILITSYVSFQKLQIIKIR